MASGLEVDEEGPWAPAAQQHREPYDKHGLKREVSKSVRGRGGRRGEGEGREGRGGEGERGRGKTRKERKIKDSPIHPSPRCTC